MRTIEGLEFDNLTRVFDAFRRNIHPQVPPEGDDGLDYFSGFRSSPQIFNKATIDLQGLDWKLVQGAERRISGPEVIHGELDVKVIQLGQGF